MTIQNRQYLHMIRQYLDESPERTYVIDRKTRKVVLGPVGTGTAKAFIQKQVQPRKFMIRDLKEPTKKVGETIGMFESASLTTENAHDFGLDSEYALSSIIQNVPMPERKIMARMGTKVLTDAVGFDNLERDIGPNGYTGRNVHLLSMEDLDTIEKTDPRSYKKIMKILLKYESIEEDTEGSPPLIQERTNTKREIEDAMKWWHSEVSSASKRERAAMGYGRPESIRQLIKRPIPLIKYHVMMYNAYMDEYGPIGGLPSTLTPKLVRNPDFPDDPLYESLEEEISEGTVMDQIRQMVQKHSMDDLKLDDGSKMPLDVQSANAVLMVYNAMNKGNQKRFEEKLSSSSKDALKMVKFAQKMASKG